MENKTQEQLEFRLAQERSAYRILRAFVHRELAQHLERTNRTATKPENGPTTRSDAPNRAIRH